MELTEITTGILLDLKVKSKNPIYSADPTVAFFKFNEKYTDVEDLLGRRPDILTMRSIMAGDVVIVKDKLVLASEVDLIDPAAIEKRTKNEIAKTRELVAGYIQKIETMDDVEELKKYYWTRGCLAFNCRLFSNMGIIGKPIFDEIYHDPKGKYPDDPQDGYIYRDKDDVWTVQMRISFKTSHSSADLLLIPGMSLTNGDGIKDMGSDSLNESKIDDVPYYRDTDFVVSKNELVYGLLYEGFDLGKKQNVEEIRSKVPEEYREAFDKGYESEMSPSYKELFEDNMF